MRFGVSVSSPIRAQVGPVAVGATTIAPRLRASRNHVHKKLRPLPLPPCSAPAPDGTGGHACPITSPAAPAAIRSNVPEYFADRAWPRVVALHAAAARPQLFVDVVAGRAQPRAIVVAPTATGPTGP